MATHDIEIVVTGKDKASKVLGGVQGALGGLGKVAGIAGLGAVGAVAGIGAGLISLAKNAEPLQGISAAFEGISESAGTSAGEMLGALQEGSNGMIAQRDLMETFNKASMLVSDQFATELPDAMGYLSQVSAATGEDMTFMMDSLVTGVGRLSPQILDNLGIQVNLAEANAVYAEQIGKTVTELTKEEQQTALMAQVMDKLKENTGAMPDVLDNAATKSAQMQAKMTNLKDSIGTKLLPMWTKLQDKLLELADKYLPKLIDFFEKTVVPILEDSVVPAIELVAEWLGENIPVVMKIVEDFWNQVLYPVLQELWKFVQDPLIPIIESIVEWLGVFIPAAFEVVKAFWNNILKPVFNAIFDIIENVVIPVIEKVIGFLSEAIPAAFELVKSVWNNILKPVFTGIWDIITDKILPIFGDLKDGLVGAFTGAVGFIKTALNGIIGMVEGAVNAAISGLNRLIAAANKIPGVTIPKIGPVKLPRLAQGGMTMAPEMLAMLHGNEAVLPLDSPRTIDALAQALRQAIGEGSTNMNYPTFQISADSPGDLFEQLQSIS